MNIDGYKVSNKEQELKDLREMSQIIQRKKDRAFEVDYRGVIHHDEALLQEIVKEHKPLFDDLIKYYAHS